MSPQTGKQGFRVSGDTIGARIKAARERTETSLADMEKLLKRLPVEERPDDVSSSVIGRWERDERSAPADYLVFLGRFAGVDPAWLLSGGEPSAADLALEAIRLIVNPPGPDGDFRAMVEWMKHQKLPPLHPGGAAGGGGL
jgi:transcriptional regulator with XRE-family HTH domain